MKLYKTTLIPSSNFSTKLKGDTLFGQICWAIRFNFGEEQLKKLLSTYDEKPFLIVSDPFAKDYLPKPTMPSIYLNEDATKKKENRKKIWLTLRELQNGKFDKAKTNEDVKNIDKNEVVIRNAINYKTSTTGDGFDPYAEDELNITPKDIYFLLDDDFSLDTLQNSLELVSQMGYGKDTTIGKGRFTFTLLEEQSISYEGTTFMALSPFTPKGIKCKNLFYEPFTRFGKTGASRANTNAFKKPLLLADSGAVIDYETKQYLQYIGSAIKNISTYKDIVHQGYSIVLPIKELS